MGAIVALVWGIVGSASIAPSSANGADICATHDQVLAIANGPSADGAWPDVPWCADVGVAVWLRTDSMASAILVGRVDSLGHVAGSPEIVASTSFPASLGAPSVAFDEAGGLVVFESLDGTQGTIACRRLDADGHP